MCSNPIQDRIFLGLNFTTAEVVCITAMINHIFISFSAFQMYDWTFIYSFVEKHPCIVFQSQVSRKKVLLGNQILPFCVSNVSFTLTWLFLLMFFFTLTWLFMWMKCVKRHKISGLLYCALRLASRSPEYLSFEKCQKMNHYNNTMNYPLCFISMFFYYDIHTDISWLAHDILFCCISPWQTSIKTFDSQ